MGKIFYKACLLTSICCAVVLLVGWLYAGSIGTVVALGMSEMKGASTCVGVVFGDYTCVGYNVWFGE